MSQEYRVLKKRSNAYELGQVMEDGKWDCEIWFASFSALTDFVIKQRAAIDKPVLEEKDGKLVEVEE